MTPTERFHDLASNPLLLFQGSERNELMNQYSATGKVELTNNQKEELTHKIQEFMDKHKESLLPNYGEKPKNILQDLDALKNFCVQNNIVNDKDSLVGHINALKNNIINRYAEDSLLKVPKDILLIIFSHLPNWQDQKNLSLVSQRINELSKNPKLIEELFNDRNLMWVYPRDIPVDPLIHFLCTYAKNCELRLDFGLLPIEPHHLKMLIENCPKLKELKFSGTVTFVNGVRKDIYIKPEHLQEISKCKTLEALEIQNSYQSDYAPSLKLVLPQIAENCKELKVLTLNKIGHPKLNADDILPFLQPGNKLESLDLSGCNFEGVNRSEDTRVYQAIANNCPNLRYLDLTECIISDQSLTEIVKHCQQLKRFDTNMARDRQEVCLTAKEQHNPNIEIAFGKHYPPIKDRPLEEDEG